MTWAILATGPSLTQEQVDAVRHLSVIAVSDAYKLAPWAGCLVAADASWWRFHKPKFAGRKFSSQFDGVEKVKVPTSLNSGALAIRVARQLGAKEIVLLGFDGHGSHFFGIHPEGLSNTDDIRRRAHMEQHRQEAHACKWEGVAVWNCTPGTAIPHYPTARLDECLEKITRG